jgi:hypothetical protein
MLSPPHNFATPMLFMTQVKDQQQKLVMTVFLGAIDEDCQK